MLLVNGVPVFGGCNAKSVESTLSARKIRDYNNCCIFGIDQYWTCKKKILLFACYSIGILKFISGNSSSHPEYKTSQIFLSLYFLVPADCLCSQTFALFRVGGKFSDCLHLFSSLSPSWPNRQVGDCSKPRGCSASRSVSFLSICSVR